jgi:hypothetical protein
MVGSERIVNGRGEWIRTTDLLVPNHEPTKNHQLSSGHNGCAQFPMTASFQLLPAPCEGHTRNAEQGFHAGGRHRIGHSLNVRALGVR